MAVVLAVLVYQLLLMEYPNLVALVELAEKEVFTTGGADGQGGTYQWLRYTT